MDLQESCDKLANKLERVQYYNFTITMYVSTLMYSELLKTLHSMSRHSVGVQQDNK